VNQRINASVGAVPVGDFFDTNIDWRFRQSVKGAFWANFLSKAHVDALGGATAVRHKAPCHSVQDLADGGLLLLLRPSPFPSDDQSELAAYAALRAFLAPITAAVTPTALTLAVNVGGVTRPIVLHKTYNT
jgi:hypothetical protein